MHSHMMPSSTRHLLIKMRMMLQTCFQFSITVQTPQWSGHHACGLRRTAAVHVHRTGHFGALTGGQAPHPGGRECCRQGSLCSEEGQQGDLRAPQESPQPRALACSNPSVQDLSGLIIISSLQISLLITSNETSGGATDCDAAAACASRNDPGAVEAFKYLLQVFVSNLSPTYFLEGACRVTHPYRIKFDGMASDAVTCKCRRYWSTEAANTAHTAHQQRLQWSSEDRQEGLKGAMAPHQHLKTWPFLRRHADRGAHSFMSLPLGLGFAAT